VVNRGIGAVALLSVIFLWGGSRTASGGQWFGNLELHPPILELSFWAEYHWLQMTAPTAVEQALKTLFLQAPSFDGLDGGAGSRYQAKPDIKSFSFPTRLAQPAGLVPNSRLLHAPADELSVERKLRNRPRL
jgi:hypothetical protein